jgi:hypothetical protein
VRVRILGREGPEAGVAVRALERVDAEACFRSLSDVTVTDADGVADLRVPDPAPATAVLELARADPSGFRHGFVPLAEAQAPPGDAAVLRLPEGGRLEVRLTGLPEGKVPSHVNVEFLSPYTACEELFSDLGVRPSEDGGIFEERPGWRSLRLRLDAEGTARVPHVASDHAVSLVLPEPPEGWLVAGATASGPYVAGREADLLRVPEGRTLAYELRFRPAPAWPVRVASSSGAPVADARVASGVRNRDGTLRLLGHVERTDAQGVAKVPLWTGARLPDWTPPALIAVVWAPGSRARIVEAEGTWDPSELAVILEPGSGRRFGVEGRILHADGRPGAGLPVRLAAAEPWNGHSALEGLATTTDGDGRFAFEVAEDLRPVFAAGPGVRVHLDAERLEGLPPDAFWRVRWPFLPRAHLTPEAIPLPAEGGRAQGDLRVTPP